MPKNFLAILVPLTEQEQRQAAACDEGRNRVRMSVWSTVARLLQPYLGKKFSTFMSAAFPWGRPLRMPFGVALGASEPRLLLHFYTLARQEQADMVERYYAQVEGEGTQVAEFSPFEGLTVTVKDVNMADPDQMPAIKWCVRFMEGKLSTEACLYYYGFGRTHVGEYALCAVELDS